MKIKIFKAKQGDCLLISNFKRGKTTNILVDGGFTQTYNDYLNPILHNEIFNDDQKIDLLCVSHIDQDHILGVITYLNHLAKWKAYEYHHKKKNNRFRKPKLLRPAEVLSIWHNSFAKTYRLKNSLTGIENSLYMIEQLTFGENLKVENHLHNKATSIKQGITLSQLIRPDQLNIPLNKEYNGDLIEVIDGENQHKIGSMDVTVLAPFKSDLLALKKKWKKFEKSNKKKLEKYYSKYKNTGEVALKLGDREEVSIPNLASIMFLVETNGASILMTGDGHSDDIIKGLEINNKLDEEGCIYVDVLKIQHHGAEANIDADFCKKVIAKHYVFCGNGSHHNPELNVIKTIFNARRGNDQSTHDSNGDSFKFWFNASEYTESNSKYKKHMASVKKLVSSLKRKDNGRNDFEYKMIAKSKSYLEIDLNDNSAARD